MEFAEIRKLNLQRRGIVQAGDNMCVSGCGNAESASHLFLHCHVFGSLWYHIKSWIGVSGVDTEIFVNIFTNLFIIQVIQRLVVRFYNYYGLYVYGWSGMNETTDCSITLKHLLISS
jgi:hypothetical protein